MTAPINDRQDIHFDSIASLYDEQLPKHIREFLLLKKTKFTLEALNKYTVPKSQGIDLGCGTGWYLKEIAKRGYKMTGLDYSSELVETARKNNPGNSAAILVGNILNLNLDKESFDFAYCINSLHHLENDSQLSTALSQINRILKPGGVLIIHELNTFFLFRIFLNYIFPLTNKIDKFGGENWVSPGKLFKQSMFEVKEIHFYTFFPHIIPKALFVFFSKINDFMEEASLRKFGAHYMAVLIKK